MNTCYAGLATERPPNKKNRKMARCWHNAIFSPPVLGAIVLMISQSNTYFISWSIT